MKLKSFTQDMIILWTIGLLLTGFVLIAPKQTSCPQEKPFLYTSM